MYNNHHRLQLPGIPFEDKYKQLIRRFVRDLLLVEIGYNENKENPPIARNLPPISGKIAWARQLYRRISGPVEVFQKNKELMALPETKKAIKKYNRLARVLVEYELIFVQVRGWEMASVLSIRGIKKSTQLLQLHIYYGTCVRYTHAYMHIDLVQYCDFFQAWGREIEAGQASLNSTVLVRHPETKSLHVNFDRKVTELLRDIQVMRGLGIEVPTQALTVYSQKAVIMERYNCVNVRTLYMKSLPIESEIHI